MSGYVDVSSDGVILGQSVTRYAALSSNVANTITVFGTNASSSCRLTGLSAPTQPADACNLQYLQTYVLGQIKGMSIKDDCLLAATVQTSLTMTGSPLANYRYWNGPFAIVSGEVNFSGISSSNGGLTWPSTSAEVYGSSFSVAMLFDNFTGFATTPGPQRLMNVGNNWIALYRDDANSRWVLSVQILNTPTISPSTTQYKYWKFADIDATKSYWIYYSPSTVSTNTTVDVNLYRFDNLLTPVVSTSTDTSSTFQYTGYATPGQNWLKSTVTAAGVTNIGISQAILKSGTTLSMSDLYSNTQPSLSIDGTTLAAGMRVLLTGQTNAVENGIYLVGSTALSRADDLAAASLASGNFVFVTSGTANGRKGYVCNALPGAETVGTHALTWTVFTSEDGKIGTTTISGGLITDSSGSISLVNNALVTTGPITSGTANVGTTLKLQGGRIFDTTGLISMDATNLSTAGNVAAANVTSGTLVLTSGKLTDSSGTISMVATNLSTIGNVSATHFTTASDERLKEEIRPLVISLNDLDKIRGLRYRWKESQREDTGLLAQEVRQLAPECVTEDPHTSLLQVDYARIIPYLVEWIRILADRDGPKA